MSLFKSVCTFDGEKIKQYTIADTKKEAIALLKLAGYKVKAATIQEVQL